MSNSKELEIAVVGAGRMGRGIALSCGLAGARTTLIDIKARDAESRNGLIEAVDCEMRGDLEFLVQLGLLTGQGVDTVLSNTTLLFGEAGSDREKFHLVFEGVPEHREAKQRAFEWMDEEFSQDTLIASTTSTFLVDDLAELISTPERFANAHWLNPAHLMPLVEISRGSRSSDHTIEKIVSILEAVGKTTVVCNASPGYIVPRIQAIAMNEAARLAEEGVASPEDIDKAIRVGFGIRYAVLGMLEFIDWGGGDILYYASDYLSKNVSTERYTAPEIVHENMRNQRNGVADGIGFFDYSDTNVSAYRAQRLASFIRLLEHLKLTPKILFPPDGKSANMPDD